MYMFQKISSSVLTRYISKWMHTRQSLFLNHSICIYVYVYVYVYIYKIYIYIIYI